MLRNFVCLWTIAATSLAGAAAPPANGNLSLDEVRGRVLVMPNLEYPDIARQLHHIGAGVYRLYFDVRGEVAGIWVVQKAGYPELDIAALKGLVRWRARPGPKWQLNVPVRFTLDERLETYVPKYHFDYHF